MSLRLGIVLFVLVIFYSGVFRFSFCEAQPLEALRFAREIISVGGKIALHAGQCDVLYVCGSNTGNLPPFLWRYDFCKITFIIFFKSNIWCHAIFHYYTNIIVITGGVSEPLFPYPNLSPSDYYFASPGGRCSVASYQLSLSIIGEANRSANGDVCSRDRVLYFQTSVADQV